MLYAAGISLLAAALALGWLGPGLQVDASVDGLVGPSPTHGSEALAQFGVSDAVLLGLHADSVFEAEDFRGLEAVHHALAGSAVVQRVTSLVDISLPAADADSLDVSTVAQRVRRAPGQARALAQSLAANPLLRGRLISADARVAVLVVTPQDAALDAGALRALARQALDTLDPVPALRVAVTGPPVLKFAAADVLVQDLRRLIPVMFAVMLGLLALAFLHWTAILWPAVVLATGVLWTLAGMAVLGIPINLVTVITPPLVMTLSLAYAMHYVSAHVDAGSARRALADLRQPFRLTVLTTAIGLLALATNPLPAIRQFAVASALGVVCAASATLLLLPGLLTLANPGRGLPAPLERRLQALGDRLGRLAVGQRRWIIGLALLVLVAMLASAARIHTGTDVLAGLPDDSPLRQDFRQLNAAMGGANQFGILIDGYTPDAMLQRAHLDAIAGLQQRLAALPGVGTNTSFVDTAAMVNAALRGADAPLPAATALKQLIVFAAPDGIYAQVDPRFRRAMLSVTTPLTDTAELMDLLQVVEAELGQLPGSLSASAVGGSVELARTINGLAQGQGVSLGIALLAILVVLSVVFASLRAGLLTLLPNLLPVAIYFGLLGLAGIPLGPTTSLVACIVLGIAVDETLHYLLRFNQLARAAADEEQAARGAIKAVIRPITLTTLALCLGFLTLSGSSLAEQALFGVLAALTLALAWVSDLILTPALGARAGIVTLWDVLRLDLGESPQDSIPLLRNLSLRQARVFALLSDLHTAPAGERIIRQGDDAGDVYVVVDGELRVTMETPDGTREVARLHRGATLGEVGLFGQKRTANVDCVTDARLLRFSPHELDVIVRRYPRIAAQVYRNLNRIQAERRAM